MFIKTEELFKTEDTYFTFKHFLKNVADLSENSLNHRVKTVSYQENSPLKFIKGNFQKCNLFHNPQIV